MLEDTALIVLGSFVSVFLSMRYAEYRMKKELNKAKNDLKLEAEAWISSEKGQKLVYTIGVLLGNAVKQGVGLTGKTGKFKWEDLIGQAIAGYIQQKIPIVGGEQPYG